MLEFSDPEVAAKYTTSFDKNPIVHVPAGNVRGSGWKGRLSEIPLKAAERLIEQKSNLLELKSPAEN